MSTLDWHEQVVEARIALELYIARASERVPPQLEILHRRLVIALRLQDEHWLLQGEGYFYWMVAAQVTICTGPCGVCTACMLTCSLNDPTCCASVCHVAWSLPGGSSGLILLASCCSTVAKFPCAICTTICRAASVLLFCICYSLSYKNLLWCRRHMRDKTAVLSVFVQDSSDSVDVSARTWYNASAKHYSVY